MTRCENDSTDGLDLSDDAGYGRRGQEAVVADNQPTNLNGTYIYEDLCLRGIKAGLQFLTAFH